MFINLSDENRKILKIGSKIFLASFSFLLAGGFCWIMAERVFFDQLLYQKSPFYGYMTNRRGLVNQTLWPKYNEFIASWRERDLNFLLSGKAWPPASKNTKTIAIIGDSFTYGLGVLPHERFSSQLADQLKKLDIKANVYNFSEPGNSIIDDYVLYQLVKKQLKPDFIIIGIVYNDLLFVPARYPETQNFMSAFDKNCPQPIFNRPILINFDFKEVSLVTAESFSPKWRNWCYLSQIGQTLAKDKSMAFYSFVPGNLPESETSFASIPDKFLITKYTNLLEQQGAEVIKYPYYGRSQDDVSITEGHPSRTAHKAYAAQIAKFLESKLK